MKPISRRTFLLGALGVGAAGALGTWQLEEHPSLPYRIGLANSPDHKVPVANVKVETGEFKSNAALKTVRWSYAMPAIEPIATVYCLHGLGGNHASAFNNLRLHDLVRAERLPLAIASVDGGNSYWHRRKDGSNTLAMLTDELIPLIESRTGTTRRSVFGWSMGGYGALLVSLRQPSRFAPVGSSLAPSAASSSGPLLSLRQHPQLFDSVVALSPALWTQPGDSAPGAFDDEEDFEAHDVFDMRARLSDQNIRVACGNDDPFYEATLAFVSQLPNAEKDFGHGYHDDAYWRSVSPAALRFITQQSRD
jgi:S-formylglutathione hydrolase FrmB